MIRKRIMAWLIAGMTASLLGIGGFNMFRTLDRVEAAATHARVFLEKTGVSKQAEDRLRQTLREQGFTDVEIDKAMKRVSDIGQLYGAGKKTGKELENRLNQAAADLKKQITSRK